MKCNYIVSGLERSGTSLMMQILEKGGVPVAYDESRKSDENNPKGYYELEKGKIINKIFDGEFDFSKYEGKFIKVTSFGVGALPPGNYNIIYMDRDIQEIIDSTQKMSDKKFSRKKLKRSLTKLNDMIKEEIDRRVDINYIIVNYNNLLADYDNEILKVKEFLDKFDINKGKKAIDKKLYRNKRHLVDSLSKKDKELIEERLRQLGYL